MTHRLSLSVQYATHANEVPRRDQFRRWIKAALQRDISVTLRIVDEHEASELNRNYRGKDYPTNVLTFVYAEGESGQPGSLSGDVVICAPVVKREAAQQHKDLTAHYAHLTIHAALHLQGYEHGSESQAAVMEALETSIMLKLHYPDPYQVR
jgi:probable rRNA maturation factor